MISKYTLWIITWFIVGMMLIVYPLYDRDATVAMWFYYMLWTVPFGTIWLLYFYDLFLNDVLWPPYPWLEMGGQFIALVIAYIFWFILMPRIRSKARKAKQPESPSL
jgi:hypothetical protein